MKRTRNNGGIFFARAGGYGSDSVYIVMKKAL
jgi:hypothetical protein